MKKQLLLATLFTLVSISNAITVYTLDEQYSQTNQTVLRFKIENNSSDTLNGIELRYHAVQDTSLIATPDLYYLPDGMANWSFDDSVNATLVIYFPNVVLYPGDTLGENSGYAVGLHNKDWSIWTKEDDPSQPTSNEFSIAENIEILSGGQSLMLDVGKYQGCPVVQFVEVEKDSLSLQVLQQLSSDSSSIIIKNKNGVSVSANLNESFVDSLGQKIWRGSIPTQDTIEHRGEIRAECKGNLLAYFAYGWKPTGAAAAVAKKLWEKTDSFVKADFDLGFNQGLADEQRLVLQKDSTGRFLDARYVENWKFYRAWEEPGENPMPVILSPVLQYEENDIDFLTLEWEKIDEVNWYRLLVLKSSLENDSISFADTAVSMFTMQTSVKIPVLPAGNYVWFVEPLIEANGTEEDEDEEYFFIGEDEAQPKVAQKAKKILKKSMWKKFKKWSKKTVKKATKYIAPVSYSVFYGGNVVSNTWSSFKSHLNPFSVIQIFVHKETLHTRTNSLTKDLKWLQKSYPDKYRYKKPEEEPSELDKNLFNSCFGSKSFCAMKDTRMLADNWKVGFDENNWNKVFPRNSLNGSSNDAVKNRCWLTMAQMINHFKGGDISEDEIMYNVRGGFGNTDGGGPIETMQAVKYALNQEVWDQVTYTALINAYLASGVIPISNYIVNTSVDGWFAGSPNLYTIISTIESGNIMGLSQLNAKLKYKSHSLVLNGYKIASNGNVYIHLLNTHNMGEEEWRYYCNISFLGLDVLVKLFANGIKLTKLLEAISGKELIDYIYFSYYIPPLYAKGRTSNADVFNDSDKDGIVDVDEKERFETDPMKKDSDDDGIEDYDEILDYKKCETYSNVFMPYVYTTINENGEKESRSLNASQISYILQSDFDGDGLHVAIDEDSDGDGYCDIQEKGFDRSDLAHSCERYDATRHPEGGTPNCKIFSVALLAKEKLQLNDRAKCVTQKGSYCPVASYEDSFADNYGVKLGVSAYVGNVYSTKSVLMRDRSIVIGNMETGANVLKQSSKAGVTGKTVENSPATDTYRNYYSSLMSVYSSNADFSIYSTKVIDAGETYYSSLFGLNSGHTDYNFNSNSEFHLNKVGDLELGSLKFQYGAKLHAPTKSVVFHIGNDFQWNGTIVADDMISAAQHIKVVYYGTNRVYVHTNFAGTIVAPNAEVVVGQSGKNFYGAIYAKSIVVHQNAKIIWVPFVAGTSSSVIAGIDNDAMLNYAVSFLAE